MVEKGGQIDLMRVNNLPQENRNVHQRIVHSDWNEKVHPGLLWVEIESTTVEEDGCLEVFDVAVATNASFDRHDFTVESFGHSVGDSMSAVAHHIGKTLLNHSSDFLHGLQLGVDRLFYRRLRCALTRYLPSFVPESTSVEHTLRPRFRFGDDFKPKLPKNFSVVSVF